MTARREGEHHVDVEGKHHCYNCCLMLLFSQQLPLQCLGIWRPFIHCSAGTCTCMCRFWLPPFLSRLSSLSLPGPFPLTMFTVTNLTILRSSKLDHFYSIPSQRLEQSQQSWQQCGLLRSKTDGNGIGMKARFLTGASGFVLQCIVIVQISVWR